MEFVDFHVHSTFSDGLFSPKELYNIAKLNNIKYLAITDHDSLLANKVISENKVVYSDVKFVSGIEISCVYMGVELHMSALGFDIENKKLNEEILKLANGRTERMKGLIQYILNISNIKIPKEEIEKLLTIKNVGKPHLVKVILNYNQFNDVEDLYKNYINKYVVNEFKMPVEKAVELIHNAGGLIFIAHPYKLIKHLKDKPISFSLFIKNLVSIGVDGLEIYNRHQAPEITSEYDKLAKKYKILTSGGSDFHGEIFAKTRLGFGNNNNCRFATNNITIFDWILKNNKFIN